MALELDYSTVKNYYNFYKTTDWKTSQENRRMRNDVVFIDFVDSIIIDDELQQFSIFIYENILDSKLFDSEVRIRGQLFMNGDKNLKDIVKWINSVFKQKHCSICKNLGKVNNNICVNCFKSTCFKVKSEKQCVICLEDINRDIHRAVCSHFFHFKCIMGLLRCPLCRLNWLDEIEFVEYTSETDSD